MPWIQLALSILLVVLVLLQRSSDGIDGSAFGGSSSNMTYFARRGFEKFIFNATIVVGILFAVSALIPLFVK
jgi:protein translocase SecG subunit